MHDRVKITFTYPVGIKSLVYCMQFVISVFSNVLCLTIDFPLDSVYNITTLDTLEPGHSGIVL